MSHFTDAGIFAIPQLALVLGIMVLVHEFGHFAVAKLCGVRVEAFAIGFGKRLFGFVHNGTDYRLNLLPLGGYVKMAGEMGPTGEESRATDDPGEYQNHPRWQRALITLAGPIANFILAFLLLFSLYATHKQVPAYFDQIPVADYISPASPFAKAGMQVGDKLISFDGHQDPLWRDLPLYAQPVLNKTAPLQFIHNGVPTMATIFVESKGEAQDFDFDKLGLVPVEQAGALQVSSLVGQNVPAAQAGLKPGDQIIAMDNHPLHSVAALSAYMQDQAGKPAVLQVLHEGQTAIANMPITPALMDTEDGKAYKLGFSSKPPPEVLRPMTVSSAAHQAMDDNFKNSKVILEVLQRLFTRQISVKALSSPIGIGVQVHQAFQAQGWTPVIGTMAMISLNLGIFNLLPIPILDGGMMVFLFIEAILRRDINAQVKERIYQVAFVCIVLFAAVVIFNDLTRLVPHARS